MRVSSRKLCWAKSSWRFSSALRSSSMRSFLSVSSNDAFAKAASSALNATPDDEDEDEDKDGDEDEDEDDDDDGANDGSSDARSSSATVDATTTSISATSRALLIGIKLVSACAMRMSTASTARLRTSNSCGVFAPRALRYACLAWSSTLFAASWFARSCKKRSCSQRYARASSCSSCGTTFRGKTGGTSNSKGTALAPMPVPLYAVDDEERGAGAGRSTTFGSVVCASSRNRAVGKSVEGTCSGTQ